MTNKEYFGQGKYFSESAGELIDIDSMAFPHAYYANNKLLLEADYQGSVLSNTFVEYLYPKAAVCSDLFLKEGRVAHVHFGDRRHIDAVRHKLRRAAKKVGKKITTHAETHWVTAHVVDDTVVKVKGILVRGGEG